MSSSKITLETLDHIAKLARIKLSDQEKEVFLPQLESVIESFDILNSVNTDNVSPTFRVIEESNPLREDVVGESFTQKQALSATSNTKDGYFVVTNTIKK
ncbi:MAG: Asp-tRNA(Asn)/Glu-tRNA(Gln) amidotransferase subunit GatC [Candidatus Shapirobacteria bacterium]|jgi:aspartyl-tRNA(Asn)/glutamyl-tRNA(Gln) amidotransferase subunit C